MGKTDSSGSYSYVCDGTSPGSPVLSDGHALYTPGLSENRGGSSAYYSNDRLGNLWTLDGTSKNQLSYQDTSGFGGLVAGGSTGTPFGYGGGNGCLSDADTGLVLMGHRYYDSRQGRFISQDPNGDGDNWYAYADNSPTNAVDPTGLSDGAPGSVGAPDQHYGVFEGGGDDTGNGSASWDSFPLYLNTWQRTRTGTYVWAPDPTAANADHMAPYIHWGAWGPWTMTDSQPLGDGFMTSTAYPPMEMRPPTFLQKLLLGAVILGANIAGHGHGLNVKDLHKVVPAEEATPSEDVKRKRDQKDGGSKFSLQTFEQNMGRLGSKTRDFVDDLTESINHTQKSYPVWLGGNTTGALE